MARDCVEVLKQIEWVWHARPRGYYCPCCEGEQPDHEDDCDLHALLVIELDLVASHYAV